MTPSYGLQFGLASDTGRVREINEDSLLVMVPPAAAAPVDALMLVADGVGGANAGEVASGMLVQSFAEWFRGRVYEELVHFSPTHPDYFIAAMKELMETANERLYHAAAARPELAQMGTTATALLISNGRAFVAHVGDTRAYLLRRGDFRQLTTDHSWVAEEVAAGRMTEEEAHHHPRRNVVSRVLGNSLLLRVDRAAHPLENGDVLLLATDGLTGLVRDHELRHVLLHTHSLSNACAQFIRLANERGGHDNITVLAARVTSDGKFTGINPQGIALSSTMLGGVASATPAAATATGAIDTRKVPATTQVLDSASTSRGRAIVGRLFLLLLVLLLTGAIGYGTLLLIDGRVEIPALIPDLSVAEIAGIISGTALLGGVGLGYLGRHWLSNLE